MSDKILFCVTSDFFRRHIIENRVLYNLLCTHSDNKYIKPNTSEEDFTKSIDACIYISAVYKVWHRISR